MTFEKALAHLKKGDKVIRKGWGGLENYVKLVGEMTVDGEKLNPYFVIHVTGEGYTMFQPTVCDILAEDWALVEG
ncbi:DUF2829 domain-containing protein [Dolosicoccus paucivorans]|uniref:DUF2829 domain-containing protein n=1 Tax=Dolosicoccus paucivorans TaxID=84521 RepID=A0A1G8LHP2_9LACT|nr:DUF2829 domain-containing protein [Dolosicoccus paucivorans]PMB84797.1 DUF2829 domain-containing protein [Dolosicoccus paucivorans]PMC58561.1 DUF2829 domain-containing protein [Dolosicoccus paucivorans]SDI55125.1 Protein of unknown function [Dolosicoccus paucivorans]